jgi:hypothetical protein
MTLLLSKITYLRIDLILTVFYSEKIYVLLVCAGPPSPLFY